MSSSARPSTDRDALLTQAAAPDAAPPVGHGGDAVIFAETGADEPLLDDCPVCLEPMQGRRTKNSQDDEIRVPTCGHRFCRGCLIALLERNEVEFSCPLCRASLERRVLLDALELKDDNAMVKAFLLQALLFFFVIGCVVGTFFITSSVVAEYPQSTGLVVMAAMLGNAFVGLALALFAVIALFPSARIPHPMNTIWFITPICLLPWYFPMTIAAFSSGVTSGLTGEYSSAISIPIVGAIFGGCFISAMLVLSWNKSARNFVHTEFVEKNILYWRHARIMLGIGAAYFFCFVLYVTFILSTTFLVR